MSKQDQTVKTKHLWKHVMQNVMFNKCNLIKNALIFTRSRK